MNESLIKQLKNFGFSDKEARVYLALVEKGPATVFEIAKSSEVNRSSAYVVLESLKKKGFVGLSDDTNVRKYVAGSPELILYTAQANAKKQENIKTSIESIMPELKALHEETKHKPVVKIFEGLSGIREVYSNPFRSNSKEFRSYSNPADIFRLVPDLLESTRKERAKKKMKMLLISPASKEVLQTASKVPTKSLSPNAETALIPEEKFRFSYDMGIYDDKVAFVSTKDNIGIVIESKEIAEMLKNSFDLAWEEAKRLDKKVRQRLAKKHR